LDFAAGETIHTENSHKYTVEEFQALAIPRAGHRVRCGLERRLVQPALSDPGHSV